MKTNYKITFKDQVIYSGTITYLSEEHEQLLEQYEWDKERDNYFTKDEVKLNKGSYFFYNSLKEKFTIKSKHLVLSFENELFDYFENKEVFIKEVIKHND